MKSFTFSIICVLILFTGINSETIRVPADQPTIQAGINAASDSDTVIVNPGTWVQGISFSGKSIVVGSLYLTTNEESYISGTVIDGNNASSAVSFTGGEDSTTVLCGFTVQNGSAIEGGGIRCEDAQPTLKNLIVRNNSVTMDGGGLALFGSSVVVQDVSFQGNIAEVGAGVYCTDSDLSMFNVIVNGNTSISEGSGLQIHFSNVELDSCTISYNQVEQGSGGGLQYINDKGENQLFEINISNTNFIGNMTPGPGGGMTVRRYDSDYSSVNIIVDKCKFQENYASDYGGLRISGQSINFTLKNSIFLGNVSETFCGAAGFTNQCTGEVTNCLFWDNIASTEEDVWNSGGVSIWSAAQVDLMNCTFVENWASYGAGLTVGGGGIATTTNCIFWGNENDQIALAQWDNVGGTLTVIYCNVEGGQEDVYISDETSTLQWEEGNIDFNPFFVDKEEEDFHLTDYSLCIGAGTSEGAPEIDMDGNPRPDPAGSKPDIGAYENSRAEPLHSTIFVSPESIFDELQTVEVDSQLITISNTGTSELVFYLNTEIKTVALDSNYALEFDGSVKTVEIANPDSFDFRKDFSITAWIMTSDYGVIISKSNAQDIPGPKTLFVGSGLTTDHGSLVFDVGFEGGARGDRILTDGIWHHVAVTAENNGTAQIKLYVDGELDGEDELNITSHSEEGFGVRLGFDGREPHEFPNFNGTLDEVSIWEKVLSQTEIQEIMSNGLIGIEPGLLGYWPMEEGRGSILVDWSENENDGTLLNDPLWVESTVPLNPWLVCKPNTGSVTAGGQMEITTIYNLAGLPDSTYEANIVFYSNDPFNPVKNVSLQIAKILGLEDASNFVRPESYQLFQNFPNPFNPITTINYQLPMISEVELSIYNVLGQRIETLVSGKREAGYYQVQWDGGEFASGVYYYRLTTDAGFVQTKKLVLLK